jgi:7,8-dihydropterin-6-yl-methyl-4-(beta-D-ribofuranosyl)aminobenzene 5'-phosphate synthase
LARTVSSGYSCETGGKLHESNIPDRMGGNMRLTVLVDNNTLIDRYFIGEPGVSYFIEDEGKNILFDVGYSNAFILNAQKTRLNLFDIDWVVLSHGHLDHTWGLIPLIRLYTEGTLEGIHPKRPALVAHPLSLSSRTSRDLSEIGLLISKEKLSGYFDLKLSKKPLHLTDRLIFLGEIEKTHKFEGTESIGKIVNDGIEQEDFILDDSALVYKSPDGLVIITGCSHSGICNVVEYAKKVCGNRRILDIIGGFHLLNPSAEQMDETMEYLKRLNPVSVHACHCTDLKSKIELSKVLNLKEVGVGLTLEY